MAAMPNFIKLLFSPVGRIGRRDYLIGLVGCIVVPTVYFLILDTFLRGTIIGTFLFLGLIFLFLQMIYSVYGKRLHDIGRTLWPLTGFLCLILAVMIIVMLTFGGADYFAAYSEYSPDNPPTDEVAEALNNEFKSRQKEGEGILGAVILGLISAFSLWLALAKSEAKTNRYGPNPSN